MAYGAVPVSALVIVLAAVWPSTSARAGDTSVSIVGVNQGYAPSSVTVDPGNTVTWTNRDPTAAPHNAICDDGCPEAFSSGPPGATGTTGSYKFRYSGTYTYHCAVHPNMTAKVIVTGNVRAPASASAAASTPSGSTGSAAASAVQSQPGNASASANTGASASASASSPGTPSASSSASAVNGGDSAATLPSVPQLALPAPRIRVHQASSKGTPWWVLLPTSLLLVVAAGACALAWLGPRTHSVQAAADAGAAS